MKVFTVGLDQKPPLKDDLEKAEKSGSPPPGYTPAGGAVPLPMGPELPLPPTPLIMRKSRGYKGILLVMLTVFLIALFALTLSEITYNRQRDENFFRLRWAELKHRFGGYADYDHYFNRGPYAYAAMKKQKELAESQFGMPLVFNQQQHRNDESSTTTTTTTSGPILAEVIDTSSAAGSRRPLGADLSASSLASSSSSSQQTSAEHPLFGGSGAPEITPAETRLQFLRSILRRIKQHAEDMGFDGMMQVSVVEVEPQGEDQNSRKLNGPSPAIQQILPGLFSHLAQQQQPRIEEPHMMNVKSDSFLDGFGEIHQPSFMQNNEIAEHNRGHLENNNNRNNEHEEPIDFEPPIQWSRVNNPFRPDAFFPRPNWQLMAAQQQQQQSQQPQQQPQPFTSQFLPPHVLPRSFEQWGGNGVADDEIMTRRFGGLPEPQLHTQQEPQQQPQPQLPPPMIQVFPQSAPVFFPSQPAPQQFGHFPAGQMMGVGAGAGLEFRPFKAVGSPPPPPSIFETDSQPASQPQPQQFQQPQPSMEGSASGQEIGETNGGRIGQFVKELIANRLQALNQLQQQQQQPTQMKGLSANMPSLVQQRPPPPAVSPLQPSLTPAMARLQAIMPFAFPQPAIDVQALRPQVETFVPLENRIQIEPPTPVQQQQQQQPIKSEENENNNNKPKSMIVDSDYNSANLNAGWTHQPKLAESDDGLESVRNFAKMMAAGVAEEAARRRAEVLAGSIPFFRSHAPLTVDSSATSSSTTNGEKPAGHSDEHEPRKSAAFMPVLSIDPPTGGPPGFRPAITLRHNGRIFSSASAVALPLDEDVHSLIFDRTVPTQTFSNDIIVRNQISIREKPLEEIVAPAAVHPSQQAPLMLKPVQEMPLEQLTVSKPALESQDKMTPSLTQPNLIANEDPFELDQNGVFSSNEPVITPAINISEEIETDQLVTPGFDLTHTALSIEENNHTDDSGIDDLNIPDARPLPLPFVMDEIEQPIVSVEKPQISNGIVVVDSDDHMPASHRSTDRLNIVPFSGNRPAVMVQSETNHSKMSDAQRIVNTGVETMATVSFSQPTGTTMVHSSSGIVSDMASVPTEVAPAAIDDGTIIIRPLMSDVLMEEPVVDYDRAKDGGETETADRQTNAIRDYMAPNVAAKFTPDSENVAVDDVQRQQQRTTESTRSESNNSAKDQSKNEQATGSVPNEEIIESPVLSEMGHAPRQVMAELKQDNLSLRQIDENERRLAGDLDHKISGSVKKVADAMVDIPTMHFPLSSKDRDTSPSSKAVVDRVSDDDAETPNKAPASGEHVDEPSAEAKDDKSVAPTLPQMNDAESAHANGVFFQVDDPAAAFGVGQPDQHSIVTA